MPRSAYIYLVYHKATASVLAVFTVRHEAETWVDKHSRWEKENLQLYRSPDGTNHANGTILTLLAWDHA